MHIDLQDLLEKQKKGTLTAQERALLETWYVQWKPGQLHFDEDELLKTKEVVWRAIVAERKNRTRLYYRAAGIAASLVLIFSFFAIYTSNQPIQQLTGAGIISARNFDFKPGGNKAILTLSDGKQISLANYKSGKLSVQGYAEVTKAKEGMIVYTRSSSISAAAGSKLIYNSVTTPRGGQYHLVLSDGTQIWLNAASSVTYPVVFAGNERRVTIKGEAYLEVAHNKAAPFLVSTGNQEIRVLGTHFNVKGYEDDASISTTLLSGSVLVKNMTSGNTGTLRPGQLSKIYKDHPDIAIRKVNASDAISWKNGYFIFDNQQITSIMKIISRWYDVDVKYQMKNTNERFGGTFSRSSNLSEILNNLEKIGDVHFKRQENKIIVTTKSN